MRRYKLLRMRLNPLKNVNRNAERGISGNDCLIFVCRQKCVSFPQLLLHYLKSNLNLLTPFFKPASYFSKLFGVHKF
jgi:hypothetical protein